jgi:hypothetical protein
MSSRYFTRRAGFEPARTEGYAAPFVLVEFDGDDNCYLWFTDSLKRTAPLDRLCYRFDEAERFVKDGSWVELTEAQAGRHLEWARTRPHPWPWPSHPVDVALNDPAERQRIAEVLLNGKPSDAPETGIEEAW